MATTSPHPSDQLRQAMAFLGEPVAAPKASGRGAKTPARGEATPGAGKSMPLRLGAASIVDVDMPELRTRVIDALAVRLDIDPMIVLRISGIADRTYARRKQQGKPLTATESDRVLRIARVASQAERVFGARDKANRWLAKDSAILGAPPLALLATDAGARAVEDELERIEWGDFA